MTKTPTFPTYTAVTSALKKTPEKPEGAQVHGLFSGLLCANPKKAGENWQRLLLGEEPNPTALEILQELYESTYHQLSEFSFEFSLLLPSDSKDIRVRAEALGLWCQGFLMGLRQGHIRIEHRSPGEVTDAINDIIEIAQVNYEDILENEEDETAYFELVEYVRLAVLMIYQDLTSDNLQKDPEENDFLH